jgi:pSer/pThr/pTyr-binding forkhead associated (FHA) protein/tetratricopeptide (TPR) repeat protein
LDAAIESPTPELGEGLSGDLATPAADVQLGGDSGSEGQNADFDASPSEDSSSTDGASAEEASNAPSALIEDDGRTKLTPSGTLVVRLLFKPDTANVTEYTITKDETSIGRGKDCDIILNDKRSSRKNAMISRAGLRFLIKDLNSSNGTYVNGEKITELELSGDDLIKIGNVEFQFKAESADYIKNERNFLSVPSSASSDDFGMAIPEGGMEADGNLIPEEVLQEDALAEAPDSQQPFANPNIALDSGVGGVPSGMPHGSELSNVAGITGLDGSTGGKKTLLERFKALPKRTQIIVVIAGLLFFWFLTEDSDTGTKKKKAEDKKAAVAATSKINAGPASFDTLTPDQRKFVENQHDLAFDFYKNKEYDKCLFELGKIFALIPDYKDSREIERYAKEGKRKLEAMEEERKKKEEEAQLRDKINNLIHDAKMRMEKNEYDQMNELFTQILALDPDNATVAEWKKQIEIHDEQLKAAAQARDVVEAINKSAWALYLEGMKLKKAGRYHAAISSFKSVIAMEASRKKTSALAKTEISRCKAIIRTLLEPVLAEAKTNEDSGDLFNAYTLFKKATKIDPPHPAGYAGINRVRGVLHDRAKSIYTEAILAESYSDFDNAKKLFKSCLDNSPVDDIYHERAARKLSHYFTKQEQAPQ